MGTFVEQAKVTSVGVLGFDVTELRLIRNVIKISSCRPQGGYEIYVGNSAINCDILIVNTDDVGALASLRSVSGRLATIVKLLVFNAEPTHPTVEPYCLRPLSPVKLLKLLDQLAFEKQLHEPANQIFSGKDPNDALRADDSSPLIDVTSTIGFPKTRRALVVDDSPTVRKQLELELEASNIHVDLAETGETGLDLMGKNYYDIIFLDVMLPGADGYHVCKHIKRNPLLKQTPVVMLTSKSSPFDRVRGSLAGCDTYLTKPVDYQQFKQVLEKYEV
ncbi:MAG: response regulator [Sideroxyarcus sp.]|nr:response regulator [Sideroxyarcus sp.]